MSEVYDVLAPIGRKTTRAMRQNPPLGDLNGKVIAELWDYLFRGDEMYQILRREITARYKGVRFVQFPVFGNTHGPDEASVVAQIPELLREYECHAAIAAVAC